MKILMRIPALAALTVAVLILPKAVEAKKGLLGEAAFKVKAKIQAISTVSVSNDLEIDIDPTTTDAGADLFSSEAVLSTFSNDEGGHHVAITAPKDYVDGNQYVLKEQTGDGKDRLLFVIQANQNADGTDGGGWVDFAYGSNIIEVSNGAPQQTRTIRAKISGGQIEGVSQGDYLAELTAEHHTKS